MLSQELRPTTFEEMAGQEENIKIAKAIIRNPDKAPKCLIFAGKFGCGKTTMARIMARALNGITDKDYDLLNSPFYYEYDSTVIGNVETIRQMRDQFVVSYGDYYRIIVFDETHAVSNAAQNALLKVLEEAIGRVFFIMCTTEPNKLLPTIRSRSLELEFKSVPTEAVESNIAKVCIQRQISIKPDVVRLIADRSFGHMRNAHMLLDKYLLLGEEDFIDSVKSSVSLYCDFLKAIYLRDKDRALEVINSLLNMPRDDLHTDWNTVMTQAMRSLAGFPISSKDVQSVIELYGRKDFNLIIQIFFNSIMKSAFVDMAYFQATFCYIYTSLTAALAQKYPNGAPNADKDKSSSSLGQATTHQAEVPQASQQAPTLQDKRVMIRR